MFFVVSCLLPVVIFVLAAAFAAVRFSVDRDGRALAAALSIGAAGTVLALGLGVALMWTRAHVIGDSIQHTGLRSLGWTLLLLGGALLAAAVAGVFVGAFGLRGALEVVLASFGLAIVGMVGMASGAMIASVTARAERPGRG